MSAKSAAVKPAAEKSKSTKSTHPKSTTVKLKTDRLDLRVTREHKELIERAASVAGQPVTSFVLSSVLDNARETLERESRTVLGDRDRAAFLAIIEGAERPAPALVRAVARVRRTSPMQRSDG